MGSAFHCEFTLSYNPEDAKETQKVKELFKKASAEFSAMGAFYTRPYGPWARLQLNKDAMGTQTLKTLKGIFDPNGILNPGKLTI
jgi:FAD/FMN-containing dehydrogenase